MTHNMEQRDRLCGAGLTHLTKQKRLEALLLRRRHSHEVQQGPTEHGKLLTQRAETGGWVGRESHPSTLTDFQPDSDTLMSFTLFESLPYPVHLKTSYLVLLNCSELIMSSYQKQRNKWCTFLCIHSAKYHQTDVGVEMLFVRCTSWLCCPSNARYLAVFIKVMYVTGWKQKCDVWRQKQAWNTGVDFDTASELGFLEKLEGRLMGLKYSLVFLKKRGMYWETAHTDKFG